MIHGSNSQSCQNINNVKSSMNLDMVTVETEIEQISISKFNIKNQEFIT